MSGALVHTSESDGIGRITLDHPPLNILTRAVLGEFRGGLERLRGDTTLRVIIVDAAGKHFSAGADVGEHVPPECDEMIPEFVATIRALYEFPTPTIVAVHGKCLGGGCELALAGDLVVATDAAVFGQPEILLGVLPPAACALLPGRVPAAVAAELVLTGDPMTAPDLHRAGLVNRVVPPDDLEAAALDLARRIARHSAASVRAGKRMLHSGVDDRGAALERAGQLYLNDLMQTDDAREGLRAFLEKRAPAWSHR